jgi:hypothetical protein
MNKVEYKKFLEAVDAVCMNCLKLSEENCERCPVRFTCDELSKKVEEQKTEEKYYYELVVSILDKDGNRRETISITGSNDRDKIYEEREKLRIEIAEGKYDKYADKFDEIIITDIEVRDNETNNLLWLAD